MVSKAPSRLLLIDGHSVAYRAFYAMQSADMTTSTGEPVGAVFGFANMLAGQLREVRPTHVAAAFDVSRRSFRTEIYPEYKATRSETPEDFKGQVPLIQEVLGALGIRYFEEPDVEADDVLATLADRASAAGMEVFVMSGDRDTFQLVSDRVTVLYPQFKSSDMAQITPAEVVRRYGVAPDRYPDLAALVGEQSDNLPGVPKVGKVTAAKWLGQYGGLDALIAHADQLKGVAGQNFRDRVDQVRLNRRLNQLRRDVPLAAEPAALVLGAVNRPELDLLFASLQFGRIKDRLLDLDIWGPEAVRLPAGGAPQALRPVVLGDGGVAEFLADYAGTTAGLAPVGRLEPGTGEAWSLAVAFPDGRVAVLVLADLGGEDASALGAWLADPEAAKAVHGAKSAAQELGGSGYELAGVAFDTEIAAYLIWPDQRGYALESLTERLLGERLAEDIDGGQGTLDIALGAPGSGPDLGLAARAAAVAHLVDPLTRELEERQAAALLLDLEQPLTAVLTKMERAGIAVDQDRLTDVRDELSSRVEAAGRDAIGALGGKEVNLGSPKALQEVLFQDLGMPKTRRTKTGYSTDAESLADLFKRTGHPFLEHLLAHRDAIKLRQMADGLLASIQDDGRIHTTFGQTTAATGRLSSSDPNLQNIPARSQVGREVRHCFVAGKDWAELLTADYSQIEMRIMAHLSGDQALIDAFNEGEDLHRSVAARVFGMDPADVGPDERGRIKAMSYGLAYGLSAYGLSRQLGIGQGEAEDLRRDYFARFGGIKRYLDGVVERARRDGYTQTILGRRRYLPDLTSPNRQRREMAERMALNAPIQGSAADIIKVAMLKVDASLRDEALVSRVILQVHDELIVEVADGEAEAAERILRREMGGAAKLKVPRTVSVGAGASWRDAAH
ncbi:MAG: DNA polymerase I [Bifidobacteriaceae bacterium]|jgi:DNA polymerase-1|nr:DNA polymerase I [Bifidobacteriaceae bacterium]